MAPLGAEELAKVVNDFIERAKQETTNTAIFAGAGVGARAGLPSWSEFISHLADVATRYKPIEGEVIRGRAADGHLLSAATVYKSCRAIPTGELFRELAAPFENPPHPENLRALVSLPVSALVTTDYDRALHDAYASVAHKAAMQVELDDPTMSHAPFITQFYIARIHGRVEVPKSMILDETDYKQLAENPCYQDFVTHLITRFMCIFVGFSFVDPAVRQVLDIIVERLAPNFPSHHLALLPEDADPELHKRLMAVNIRVLEYATANNHEALWEGIEIATRKYSEAEKTSKPPANIPLGTIRRFVAMSYSRAKMKGDLQPLRDLVLDGMILEVLHEAPKHQVAIEVVASELRKFLSLTPKQATLLTNRRIDALCKRGACDIADQNLLLANISTREFGVDIKLLIQGATSRFQVRESQAATTRVAVTAGKCIEETFLARGWDLGAHYAGAASTQMPELLPTITAAVRKNGALLTERQRKGLALSCLDLFQRPDTAESQVLAEVGRVAFGLQLVLNSPCSTISHQTILPERIYLDANVLMPIIVDGHPLQAIYLDALQRLKEAASTTGGMVSVAVVDAFLREVIAHRRLARQEVEAIGLEDPDELANHLSYEGAEAVNVFVGAYASWVGRSRNAMSFSEFLATHAPYRTEGDLSKYLSIRKGISTVRLSIDAPEVRPQYDRVKRALKDAYHGERTSRHLRKQEILVEDEARQISQLALDLQNGMRAIFVTKDATLRRLLTGPVLEPVSHAVMSHRGIVQLIDLLVGLGADSMSLARLFWGGAVSDEATRIRTYYTNLALRHYDTAMAMALPEVLTDLVSEVTETAARERVALVPTGNIESKVRRAKFLDRFENKFYSKMADVIRKKTPAEHGTVDAILRRRLANEIQVTNTQITKLEERSRRSPDPKKKAKFENLVADLRRSLADLEKQREEVPEPKK